MISCYRYSRSLCIFLFLCCIVSAVCACHKSTMKPEPYRSLWSTRPSLVLFSVEEKKNLCSAQFALNLLSQKDFCINKSPPKVLSVHSLSNIHSIHYELYSICSDVVWAVLKYNTGLHHRTVKPATLFNKGAMRS